ncbi:hypothetical protein C8R43DRAFT_479210 [Mycena crocata]|nr:hypothetical protein C8R43DRAFT_479210 [Mycena crocata]
MDPHTSWSDVPTDVLIAIMGFLDPQDILALRPVSKSLFHATCERSVWIDTLRRVCIQHDVYGPSFPLTEMSLAQLEHAATAGRRFRSRLRHDFSQQWVVWPHSVRFLQSSFVGDDFENLRLLSGGRFLLTTRGCVLQMWDLGLHLPADAFKTDPIASLPIEGITAINSARARASHLGPEVLVFVGSTEYTKLFHVHVFSIHPAAANPQFKPFAPVLTLPVNDDWPAILGTTSRHIAITTGYTVVLWDFITDSWISWSQEPTEFDDTFYLCNGNVVLMRADRAQIWIAALPTFHLRSVSTVPPLIGSLPILKAYDLHRFNLPDPLQLCVSGITLVFHGREMSTLDQPLYVDILSDNHDQALLTHFALVPTTGPSQTDDKVHCELLALGESPLEAVYRSSHCLHLEWVSRHTIQSFVVEGSTLHVCLSDVDGRTSSSVAGFLAMPGLPAEEFNIDFCSFSGRICARIPTDEGYMVAIRDYVSTERAENSG